MKRRAKHYIFPKDYLRHQQCGDYIERLSGIFKWFSPWLPSGLKSRASGDALRSTPISLIRGHPKKRKRETKILSRDNGCVVLLCSPVIFRERGNYYPFFIFVFLFSFPFSFKFKRAGPLLNN